MKFTKQEELQLSESKLTEAGLLEVYLAKYEKKYGGKKHTWGEIAEVTGYSVKVIKELVKREIGLKFTRKVSDRKNKLTDVEMVDRLNKLSIDTTHNA